MMKAGGKIPERCDIFKVGSRAICMRAGRVFYRYLREHFDILRSPRSGMFDGARDPEYSLSTDTK